MRPPKLQREGVTDMPLSIPEEGSQHCSRAPTLSHISGHLGRRLTYLWRAGWAHCSTRRPHSSSRCRSRRGTSLDSPRPPGSLGSGTCSIQSGEGHQHLPALPSPPPLPAEDDPGHTHRRHTLCQGCVGESGRSKFCPSSLTLRPKTFSSPRASVFSLMTLEW